MLTYNCKNVENQEPGVNSSQKQGEGRFKLTSMVPNPVCYATP